MISYEDQSEGRGLSKDQQWNLTQQCLQLISSINCPPSIMTMFRDSDPEQLIINLVLLRSNSSHREFDKSFLNSCSIINLRPVRHSKGFVRKKTNFHLKVGYMLHSQINWLKFDTWTQSNVTRNPIEDYINQNTEQTVDELEDKRSVHNHHHHKVPRYHLPPPPPPPHPPVHPPYPHFVDWTIIYLTLFLVLGAILGVCLHGLSYTANNTTLLSNSSFSPNIVVNVNSTSDSESSADTSNNVSINGTYPVFVYENGTLINATFIPIYGGGWGFGGLPIFGGGFGGNIGRSIYENIYENFDDILEEFTSSIESLNTDDWSFTRR